MADDPPGRLPDILMYRGRHGADHPAIPIAAAHLFAHALRLGTVPEFLPRLRVQVPHDLLILRPVARHHITVGIDEEGVKAHVAGQKTLLSVDIIDETVIEVRAEPLLRTVRIEKLVDEIFKVLRDHRAVVDDILCLHKVEAVM